MVVFWPKKNVTINIVCPVADSERVLSLIHFNGCQEEEFFGTHRDGTTDIYTISGITGSPAHMSSLMKALEDLEWDTPDKIYIFVGAKKKNGGKKNGKTAGTEVPAGCEGGDPEGADRAAEHREAPGVDGDRDSCRDPALPGPEGIS
jgi:hypothetical protein